VKIVSGKIVRVTLPNVERLSEDERILCDETVWLSWHASSPVVVTQCWDSRPSHETGRRHGQFASRGRAAGSAVDSAVPLRAAAVDRVRPQELVGPAPGHRGAVPVAADLLPDPVPDRAEDLVRRVLAARAAAVRAGVPVAGTGRAADQ